MEQSIPEVCDISNALHRMDRRGAKPKNYETVHARYVEEWRQRERSIVTSSVFPEPLLASHAYMSWYRSITKLAIAPASTDVLLARAVAEIHSRCARDLAIIRDNPGEIAIALETLRSTIDSCQDVMERVGRGHLLDTSHTQQSQASGSSSQAGGSSLHPSQPHTSPHSRSARPSHPPRGRGRGRGRARSQLSRAPPSPPPPPSPPLPPSPPPFSTVTDTSTFATTRLQSPPIRTAYHRRRQQISVVDLQIHSIAEDESDLGSSPKRQRES